MNPDEAVQALSALGQPTRLAIFRLMIRTGPTGMVAGDIAERLAVRQNTLSTNLAVLLAAGLLRNERQGRSVRYFADLDGVRTLLGYLLEDCCGGHPERCRPLLDDLAVAGESTRRAPSA